MNMVLGAVGGKELTWIDEVVNFFEKIDPVATVALAVLNLVLVMYVFRFTKKMSQSKLSISTESRNVMLTSDGWDKLNKEYEANLRSAHYRKNLNFKGEGFPIPVSELNLNPKVFSIRVKNRGDLPSTNIKIVLTLKIYKTQITYDGREKPLLDVIDSQRELHATKRYNISIPYIGADEERVYELFEIHGQIREAELILDKIQANGHKYFNRVRRNRWFNPTIINHYEHPYMNQFGDNHDNMILIGHRSLWKEVEDKEAMAYGTSSDDGE
ncbi:hypothetical protein EVJ24_14965 [Exiguobacterium sp. SH1S21]|uniref:hypothetical protein n=1 Tax=Exiguobacterium sp. SH1S21 TaxID=2510953 RepID=UPI00103EB78D|nr:hypothetical protein [Exiguobacterium sp. SH1S21]TCI50307.1 hypothetical protein EVJ24_14965 [Exiguobacterium sp. SH1S21]